MNASANKVAQKLRMISSGFTLIELMVTIAVLAIIVSIAAPNISTQLANQRVKSTTATLANALKEAKAESLIRRQEIKFSYDNNDTDEAGTITFESDNAVITTYQYSAKSIISSNDDDELKFKPNKTVDTMEFTICDSNTNATPRQVAISSAANIAIRTNAGATC